MAPAASANAMGAWTTVAPMTSARFGAAAAALSDGRVLVAGGSDGSANATASAEVYDETTNTWTPVAPMGSARLFAVAAPLPGDRVLVAGGENDLVATSSAEIFDGTTDTWTPAAPMSVAREGGVAAALPDGKVWVSGGQGVSANPEVYDPVSGAWSGSYQFYARLGAAASPLADGGVLVAGGVYSVYSAPTTPWEIDYPATNAIGGTSSELPVIDDAAAAALGDGGVVLAGGVPAGSLYASNAAYVFDQTNWGWSAVAPMSSARLAAVAATLPDGRALVAGGEDALGHALASAEAYSPPVVANLTAPVVQELHQNSPGEVLVGDQLTASAGSWTGNATSPQPLYTYQWQRCLATCVDVGGPEPWGNTDQHIVTADDVGAKLRVVVTAAGAVAGTASAASNEVGPVPVAGVHFGTLETSDYQLLWKGDRPALWIPIHRDGYSGTETVSYRVWDPNPGPDPLFAPVTGTIVIPDGWDGTQLPFPVLDHGVPIMPATLDFELYDGSPLPVVGPSTLTVPMSADPGQYIRDPANPLDLPHAPGGDPLAGARLFTDYLSRPGANAVALSTSNPLQASKLAVIARQPNVERFGAWDGSYPGWNVATYLNGAAKYEPGTVPEISTYRLVDGHCTGHWSDPPADQSAYHAWITSLAEGIGPRPAVLFLEMDSLITAGCLSPQGVAVRMHELHDAIDVLSDDPHLVIYLDAGAADALPARRAASLLRQAGVSQIQGFFLNSTHFDWTSREIRYGEQISRLTGGKHFVVNTAENGQGPLRPRHPATQGNEVLCDPPGRGLGPLPTETTGYRNVDAFAWIANPGVSGGQCRRGAPPSGVFWPALALELVRHADYRVR